MPFMQTPKHGLAGAAGIRLKGYTVSSIVGSQPYAISQPGNMRKFAGLNLYKSPSGLFTDQVISLIINSDTVLDTITAQEINPETHLNGSMIFFPIDRDLFGNDSIQFNVTATAVLPMYLVIYYYP